MKNLYKRQAFSALSKIYDKLAYDINYTEWTEYLLKLNNKSGNTILEYGCGTGNITEHIIKNASKVIALDSSQEMLEIADQKLRRYYPRVRLINADMVFFKLHTPVDTVICVLDVINYILDFKSLLTCFQNIYKNLKNDGIFLFDISTKHRLKNILGNLQYFDDSHEQTFLWQNNYDNTCNVLKMELSIFMNYEKYYKRYDEVHYQRAWEVNEIVTALKESGFSSIDTYKFCTDLIPNTTDERIQFKAIRRA